ncbi:non-specific serine/threonine protein kinase [Nemania sp. NC0429]|nr:non-specific serine/threonine protein kinase [Nemania sp. NC0429]
MSHSQLFEEGRLPWYSADQFYPVHLGEVFISKYKVVGKLGYGAHSTVWLFRDIKDSGFVALKVCTRNEHGSSSNDRELKFYEHVISLNSQHHGQEYIRGLLDTFETSGPTGQHLCLVQPPMHMTIQELQRQNVSKRLNKQLLNWTLFNLLSALSFLHDELNLIHTDINPSNIMLTVDDESLLSDFEQAEIEEPSPTEAIDTTRTIYGSRKLGLPKNLLWGRPVLCDFGEAQIGQTHRGLIQPDLYRAPEMVGYIGIPPLEYLRRSEVTKNVFDEQGHLKAVGGVAVPEMPLERAEIALEGEEKRRFLVSVRSMLRWLPEERRRAVDLLADPWMEGAIP